MTAQHLIHYRPNPARTPDDLDPDLDALQATASAIVDDLRMYDPNQLHEHLKIGCYVEPARMAQVLMVLAAWVDPEESTGAREARVDALTQTRNTA